MNTQPKILIADDDRIICQSLKLLFSLNGFEPAYIINPLNIIEFSESFNPDLVILDMNFNQETTGVEGLGILRKLKSAFPTVPIILITAWGTLELAVSGMKIGAADFLTKPWENEEMLKAVRTQLQLRTQSVQLKNQATENLLGRSPIIEEIRNTILRVADTEAPILLTGAEGVGKEFLAEQIHDLSSRKTEAFLKEDLGAWEEEQIRQELLGYSRGAFAHALQAKKGLFHESGTLYLSNIETMPLGFQHQFLRILQEKTFTPIGSQNAYKFQTRLVSSSTVNLEQFADFREDLLYKIGLVHIRLPSLAERPEDIPFLTRYFVDKLNEGETQKGINESALEWLSIQDFPGNISELRFWVERTYLLSGLKEISIKELKKFRPKTKTTSQESMTLEEMEKNMIEKAIKQKKGNMAEVAKKLGITRSSLYRRMNKFGISNAQTNED